MKDEPRVVIRVLKEFKTAAAVYEAGEVYGVRASLAQQFVSQGLVEMVNFDSDEDEDEAETITGPVWEERELGTFHFDGIGWVGRVPAPAFKAFGFGGGRGKSTGTYRLVFESDSEEERPTAAAVAVAKQVLANQEALVARV